MTQDITGDANGQSGHDANIGCLVPPGVLANYVVSQREGDAPRESTPLTMAQIVAQANRITGDWPRRVGSSLFAHDGDRLARFDRATQLFAWLHAKARRIQWANSAGCVTKDEFFEYLRQSAPQYEGVYEYPHFAPMPGYYYTHPPISPSATDKRYLNALLDRFAPKTEIDRDLILAYLATALWGGPPGARPVFLITSEEGRGVGKTFLAKVASWLVGGMFEFAKGEDVASIKKRLLTSEALGVRLALLDNVKTRNFSWAEFESLVTADQISGHRLYQGEARRPNDLTWAVTMNAPSVSKDVAQRSVVIELARPKYSGRWEQHTRRLVERFRWQIIGDIAAFFGQPQQPLHGYSRWGQWEHDILRRLPEPNDARKVIAERQQQIDGERCIAEDLADYFTQRLAELGYDTDEDEVHIPSRIAAAWFNEALHTRKDAGEVTSTIDQLHKEGTLKCLARNPCRAHGRGIKYIGVGRGGVLRASYERPTGVLYDLEERVRSREICGDYRCW